MTEYSYVADMNNRSYGRGSLTTDGQILAPQRILWRTFEIPLVWNIFGSHAKRLGLSRVMFGGTCMYLSLPFFIIAHTTGLFLMIQWLLTPLFGIRRRNLRDYVIIDRYKISGLTLMDRINCMFCGYANGSVHFLNTWLDDVAANKADIGRLRRLGALVLLAVYFPALAILQVITLQVVYELLVARPLALGSMSRSAGLQKLNAMPAYAIVRRSLFSLLLRFEKLFALRLSFALAQIESSWCPLKHLDRRAEASYPDHHRNFFEADQVEEMLVTLAEDGSVLRRRR